MGSTPRRRILTETEPQRTQSLFRPFRGVEYRNLPSAVRPALCAPPHDTDVMPLSCGWFLDAHHHAAERSGLDEGVLIYGVDGRGWLDYAGRHLDVTPGDLLYLPPGSAHAYGAMAGNPWTIWWMHLAGRRVGRHVQLAGFRADRPLVHIGIQPAVMALFRMLLDVFDLHPDAARWAAMQAAARHILAHIAALPTVPRNAGRYDTAIREVLAHIAAHLDAPLALPALARRAGLSTGHFCRVFRAITGRSPIDHLIRLRMDRACVLFADRDRTVADIARELGYEDPGYFARLFRQVVGLSPRAFRDGLVTGGAPADGR